MFERKEDGLVLVTGQAGMFCGLWHRTTLRKPMKCTLTGSLMAKGRTAYKPITNTYARGQRVDAEVMDRHADYDMALMGKR